MKKLGILLFALRCMTAQVSPCDLNKDGVVNVLDVQLAIDQAIGVSICGNANLLQDGCTLADVQDVVSAALGGTCTTATSGPPVPIVDSVTIYEADGLNQTGRPVTFGRVFAQGEFSQCLQPVVAGTPVASYQVDVKNRWPDGSVKIASVSLIAPALTANGLLVVGFQAAASCNNVGYLNQPQMVAFNSGNWGADLEVTANGATQTANAKTMLNNLGFQDCQLTYWLQGPVVTQAIVQDCTSSSAYDFGWHWNGTSMSNPATGNASTASLHPMFILSFYPATNALKVDFILENMWTGRMQDQKYSFVLKTGNPLAQAYTSAGQSYADGSGNVLQLGGTRWIKTFWSGSAPGHLRIDHNFAYLTSTKLMLNYDLVNASVSPDSVYGSGSSTGVCAGQSIGDYQCFINGDKGDITGHALMSPVMNGGNDKGSPMSREELEYLYNMGSCGIENSACAKAWYILTGQRGASDFALSAEVPGGGGMWYGFGNWPMHQRESRAGGSFYCPGYDNNNTTQSSTCGSGTGPTTGHGISRHAYPTSGQMYYGYVVPPVGSHSMGPWSLETNCSHWVEWAYPHYLLTGSYFAMEEVQQGANFCDFAQNPDSAWYDGNGVFTFFPFLGGTRNMSWSLQQNLLGATVSPDGTAEQSYYNAVIRANAAVMEGFYGITGTSLTPSTTNGSCTSYGPRTTTPPTATRWDFGHCGHGFGIFPTLHNPETGACWNQDVYTSQQTVTAATSANPSQLTMASSSNLGGLAVSIWGATGSWSAINTPGPLPGSGNYGVGAALVDGTHVAIPCLSCGSLSQSLTGTVQITNGMVDQTAATDMQEPWMDWGYGVVVNRATELGFTAWSNLQTQINQFLLDMVEDSQFNPWLISLYEMGTKNGGAACSSPADGASLNAFLPTWAAVKNTIVPGWRNMATFDASQTCGADHAYPLIARSLGSFLPKVTDTCSQGTCSGLAAWIWLQQHIPFYTTPVSGSMSCAAGNDIQIKFAVVPRP